jgi:hypothetical protein
MSTTAHVSAARRVLLASIGVALVLGLLPAQPLDAHHRPTPHFRDVWCDKVDDSHPYERERRSRNDARSYASTAIGDGYQWGGGCWNGNGVDEQPNDPPRDPTTGGEGGDCSGFVFKSWFLRTDTNSMGFQWYSILHYIHGPYTAQRFRDLGGAPLQRVGKNQARMMDAFASGTHIGMLYSDERTPDGQNFIIEAKSERDGTGVWTRTYRSNSSYHGVERRSWLQPPSPCPDCGWIV